MKFDFYYLQYTEILLVVRVFFFALIVLLLVKVLYLLVLDLLLFYGF